MKVLDLAFWDKKLFYVFCKNVTPGGNIWNQGHGLTKLGRGLPADVTYQYQRARPCGYRQGDIFMCSQYNPI